MDPITWIVNLPGPEFLLVYWTLSIVVIAGCTIWARRLDPLPGFVSLPTHPDARTDPYELAWLRDGGSGMLMTALFALRQQGRIVINDNTVTRIPDAPQPEAPAERAVFAALGTPRKVSELISDTNLASGLDHVGHTFRERFVRAGLVTTEIERARAKTAMLVGLAAILGVGGLKLAVALSRGYTNVWFLIITATIVSIALAILCRPQRLNARGRAYLKSLVATFKPWGASAATAPASDSMLPLYVGMLGTGILVGTQYDDLDRAVKASTASGGGGGCGSDSGGGSDGGGSCGGGGCGGCGGD